jgi:hypothetical protein
LGLPAVAALAALLFVSWFLQARNTADGLGFAPNDIVIGRDTDLKLLRARTKTVADTWLTDHPYSLRPFLTKPDQVAVDYARASWIRSLGCYPSFYYYCWEIYLPCRDPAAPPGDAILLLHLNDSSARHFHDIEKFRVISASVLDRDGRVIGFIP